MTATRIILFAKAPLPGHAKTRLAPALGMAGAAQLAARMLAHTLGEALAAGIGPVELCASPAPDDAAWARLRADWPQLAWTDQGKGDLGARMAQAARRGLEGVGGGPVLLIGADCPALDRTRLAAAAAALASHDMVMHPAHDGGYVLLGLRQFAPQLFTNMAWSTATVAAETLRRAAGLGWRVAQLASLADIDTPADLGHVPQHVRAGSV